MKKTPIALLLCAVLLLSFFLGRVVEDRAQADRRLARCRQQIVFAIDKIENDDHSDPDIRASLASNLYAAHEYCDDPHLAALLHDLWNTVLFRNELYLENTELLTEPLRNFADALQIE